jgi:hypothetical protein
MKNARKLVGKSLPLASDQLPSEPQQVDWSHQISKANSGDEPSAWKILLEAADSLVHVRPMPMEIALHFAGLMIAMLRSQRPLFFFPDAPKRRGRKGPSGTIRLARALRLAQLRGEGVSLYDSDESAFHVLAREEGAFTPEEIERRAATLRRSYERVLAKYAHRSPPPLWQIAPLSETNVILGIRAQKKNAKAKRKPRSPTK